MKSLSLTFFVLLFSLSLHAATIAGTVTNESQQPLASMNIAAYTTAGVLQASGSSTASGSYSLTLPAGSYHLLAYDPTGTYATSFYADAESFDTSSNIVLTSAQNATNINIRLLRAGFIAGRVISSSNGTPLGSRTVAVYNLSGTRRGFTTTDVNGNFTLAVPPGSYRVAAYDETLAYATTFFANATSFETASLVSVTAGTTAAVNVQLPLAVKFGGIVRDRNSLVALPNVRVTAYGSDGAVLARTFTSADGRYAIAVRPGAVRIVVDDTAGNYATTYAADFEAFSVQPAITANAGESITLDVTLVRAGTITGHVTDRTSGLALPNITVAAYNADGTTRAAATTDATGVYSIAVPPGDYRIGLFDVALVYLPQFHSNQQTFAAATIVHVPAQQTVGAINFAGTKGARINGQVVARGSGTPLAGITVAAYDLAGRPVATTTSDTAGGFTLLIAPAVVKLLAFDGSLQFATSYYRDAPTFLATETLSLFEGQSVTTTFTMQDAGRVAGFVISATDHAPLQGVSILVFDASLQTIAETVTHADGTFRLAVPPGAYIVAASDSSHRYATSFYGGGSGTLVNVAAHQDIVSMQFLLEAASAPPRRRAASH